MYIVAVDGPAGSGKSTISKEVARRKNLTYIDTGAMYRMVTWYFLENKVGFDDIKKIKKLLPTLKMDISENKFILNGMDISNEIRMPEVAESVSIVAALRCVRETLVDLQREIAKDKNSILDGRDIGTVVFPNANRKIYLVASPEARASRRLIELEKKGVKTTYEEVIENIKKRDYIDSNREESPLKKAEDAIEIDTSDLGIEEVVDKLMETLTI